MRYKSTRSGHNVSPAQAVLQGISPDGGLFVPLQFEEIALKELIHDDYKALARHMFSLFFTDFSEEAIAGVVESAYDDKFDKAGIAPLKLFGDRAVLELFHGPTLAFKDMALSVLPHLMKEAQRLKTQAEDILILTATSGDTGKAALEGFKDVPGTRVIVFYPMDGVSSVQERQMLTQQGDNLKVFALKGNFDDAQTAVKNLFSDPGFQEAVRSRGSTLSSANSINIGRLIPQVVYYFHAYLELVRQGKIDLGEAIDLCVPTGNFGNILAGVYAKKLGLPITRFICASNQNHVLTDFFTSGVYDARRELLRTSSPSMDILVSSNLERYLYALKPDEQLIRQKMQALKTEGVFTWPGGLDMIAGFADEEEVSRTIYQVFAQHHYLIDPHTAVAWQVLDKNKPERMTLIISTASAFKFPEQVLQALGGTPTEDTRENIEQLARVSGTPVPHPIKDLWEREPFQRQVVDAEAMQEAILRWLDE